tara:strand:+ start:7338 stop:7481 length:144 start_codon:yes stop_codon:yes gene_type:complete
MFKNNHSIDMVAWVLFMNTKISNWEQAKQVAKEMREQYDEPKDECDE